MELDLSFVKHSRGQGLSLSLPSTLNQLHMLLTLAGAAGPETELSSQCGPEPEPDVASPTRTELEPTWPMLDGPGSELGP